MDVNQYCCDETTDGVGGGNSLNIKMRLIGKTLYLIVNGVTVDSEDLSSLSTGGGEVPTEYPLPVDVVLPVSSNGQTVFTNVVPENAIVVELIVNTFVFSKGLSFNIVGNNIEWVNDEVSLAIGDTVILRTWQL